MTGSGVLFALRRWLPRTVLGAIVLVVLVTGATAFRVWQFGRVNEAPKVDAILVLGAAQYDGDPSSVLRARLNQAMNLYQHGIATEIVTVGGRQPADRFTEAEAGDRYLTDRGVPADRIIEVNSGTDTLASLRAAAVVFQQHGWRSAVLVSDPWHMLRSKLMAQGLGIQAWTAPTHSGPAVQTRQTEFWYVARETAATLYYRIFHAPANDIGAGIG